MNNQEPWFDDRECDFCSNKSEKTESFSATRPPQHKKANESSQQVAGTTAALLVDSLAAAVHTRLHIHIHGDGDGYAGGYECEANYPVDHKPASNVSNATASTDATAVADVTASAAAFTAPVYHFARAGLTESVLAEHQHELQLLNPGDMGAWLEGAGPGCARLAVLHHHHSKGHASRAPRSKPSQASDASYDLVAPPTTEAVRSLDILAAGALFDEQTYRPYMYTSDLDM